MGSLVKELFIYKRAETEGTGLQPKEDVDPKEFDRSFKDSSFYPDLPVIENSFITVQNNPSNTLQGVNGQANPSDNNMDAGATEMQDLQRIQNSLLKTTKQPIVPPIPTNFDNPKFHLAYPGCCSLHEQSKTLPNGAAGEMPFASVGPGVTPANQKAENPGSDTGRGLIDPNLFWDKDGKEKKGGKHKRVISELDFATAGS